MTLKKTAKSKRANPPREFSRTKEFKKDWQRLAHSGRYDMNRLKEAMLLLIENTVPLPPEWLDHALAGNWTITPKSICVVNTWKLALSFANWIKN